LRKQSKYKENTETMKLFGVITANQDMAQLPGLTDGTSAGAGNIGEQLQAGPPR
jgi:hypothetical protein